MEYIKPEITVMEAASAAIQSTSKPLGMSDSIPNSTHPSVNAYESDE